MLSNQTKGRRHQDIAAHMAIGQLEEQVNKGRSSIKGSKNDGRMQNEV